MTISCASFHHPSHLTEVQPLKNGWTNCVGQPHTCTKLILNCTVRFSLHKKHFQRKNWYKAFSRRTFGFTWIVLSVLRSTPRAGQMKYYLLRPKKCITRSKTEIRIIWKKSHDFQSILCYFVSSPFSLRRRTWDEHIFELTLMQSMCVGHVDVKFSLHPSCQLVPNIQVTLLKLKNDGKMCDTRCKESTGDSAIFGEGSSASASSPGWFLKCIENHNSVPYWGRKLLVIRTSTYSSIRRRIQQPC